MDYKQVLAKRTFTRLTQLGTAFSKAWHQRRSRYFFVLLPLLAVFAGGCQQNHPHPPPPVRAKQPIVAIQQPPDKVDTILEACPSWLRPIIYDNNLSLRNQQINTKILRYIQEVNRYDTKTIRIGVVHYIQKHPEPEDEYGNLYILNRYIFNIPQHKQIKGDYISHFAWNNNPRPTEGWIWPLAFDRHHHLQLVGISAGYMGFGYEPLPEFDYFSKHYGRRRFQQGRL